MRLPKLCGSLVASLLLTVAGCNSTGVRSAGLTDSLTAAQVWQDVHYLASDDLEGRGVGTKGLDTAADYIADRFRSLGLRTVGSQSDYFQPFELPAAASVDPATHLTFADHTFELGTDYRPTGFSADGTISAPIAFVGYGVADEQHSYDDYAGIDVTGKVVLMLRYEPHDEKGRSRFNPDDWSPAAALDAKAKLAAKHGAVAVLLVNPPRHHRADRLMPLSRGGAPSKIPFIHVTQKSADELLKLAGADKTIEQLQDAIDGPGKPHSFELSQGTLAAHVALTRAKVPVKNVMACLPGGSKPDEYIVVGAHYDHLGRGGSGSLRPNVDEIHNGADDNASGTAAVLALAERLVSAGRRDRSIVFVLFTGEESGLLGSDYFVDHPPVPLERIVAMVNLDMVGRVRNDTLYVGGAGTADAFEKIVEAADAASPLQLKSIGKGGRGPSDHQSFSMKGIPVLFLFSGNHPDYHRPTDDADKINYQGIALTLDLTQRLIDDLSRMPRQQYASTFDADTSAMAGVTRRSRVTLGVVPDYGTDESTKGVRISGTTPGTAAAAAGLKDGDVIVQLADKKIENIYDLTEFLGRANPGDQITIIVDRDHQRVEFEATLTERKS